MRKSLVAVALATLASLSLLLASAGFADWPPGTDLLGMYTADDGSGFANVDVAGGNIDVYLVVTGVSESSGLQGWECLITFTDDPSIFWGSVQYNGQVINVATPPEFAVGIAAPLPRGADGSIWLAKITFLVFGAEGRCWLQPNTTPSVPGAMVYVKGDDVGVFIEMGYSSGDEADAVFGFNTGPLTPPIATEGSTWGNVKDMYR